MGTVKFVGSVENQFAPGEVVTIVITKPDASTENVTALTLDDLSFSAVYSNEIGDYSAVASIEADMMYDKAESTELPFSIAVLPRTITLALG